MATKSLEPDYSKKLFTIEIEVFENSQLISIKPVGEYKPKYQEAVGAIEVLKIHLIKQQSEFNKTAYKNYLKQRKKNKK